VRLICPAALPLFVSGLAALELHGRRRKAKLRGYRYLMIVFSITETWTLDHFDGDECTVIREYQDTLTKKTHSQAAPVVATGDREAVKWHLIRARQPQCVKAVRQAPHGHQCRSR
jgi:hypothetical protein